MIYNKHPLPVQNFFTPNCDIGKSGYLTSVSATLLDAGTHHVVTDVQFHLVGNLLVETIAQNAVDHRYDDVLNHV